MFHNNPNQPISIRIFFAVFLFCSFCASLPAQQVEDFEDIEAVTKKGFFPTYFKGLFKDFFVADPSWDMNGGLNFSMRSYTALGATERQDPFFYTLGANVNTRLWKVQLPLSVVITAKNTMANYPKPKELFAAFKDDLEARKNRFVRIGISPRYKWIKLHFGHRNMNFSQFSISNLTYLGLGFEMTPGKVRIAGMAGRLAKAVPLDISLLSNTPPAFTRRAEAIKVGYGSAEQFIDICRFVSKDDPISISIPPNSPTQLSPETNEVLAVVAQKTLFKKLKLRLDIGSSAISTNALDAPGANQFPHDVTYQAKNTSLFKLAMDNTLDFQTDNFTLGIQQKRIDPGFKSHGVYFFNADVQDINLRSSFALMKGLLRFNLSGGFQQDNLDKSKITTTTRLITTDNVTFAKGAYTVDLNYSNNSSNISYLLNTGLDSLNVILVSQDAGLNFSWMKADQQQNQRAINLNINRQAVSDNVDDPTASAASEMWMGNLTYSLAMATGWTYTAKGTFNRNRLSGTIMNRYGGGISITKNFLEGKISSSLDLNYLLTKVSGVDNIDNTTAGLRINWNISPQQSINMAWNHLSNRTLAYTLQRFGEVVGSLGYQYNFGKPNIGKKKKKEETPVNER